MSSSYTDISATVTNSDYKWLSATLKSAQNGPAYQPYYKVKIIDDDIEPNAIISPPGAPLKGKAVNAPDGTIVMVGNDGTGKLRFWKLTDASQALPTGTVLQSSYATSLNASLAVSDYYNGSYVIDVYYYTLVSGTTFNLNHIRSTDGGVTWGTSFTVNAINATAVPGITFTYVSAGKPVIDPTNTTRMKAIFFYNKKHGANNFYQIYYQERTSGSSFQAETAWSAMVDSNDWTIHSLDSIYNNGSYTIIFSGFHNWYENLNPTVSNFGIYSTRLDRITEQTLVDVWQLVRTVFSSTSSIQANKNVFTYPIVSTDGDTFFIVFNALVSEGLTTAQSGSTQTGVVVNQYYYLITTSDLENFSYPVPILFTDGTIYFDTAAVGLVPQTSNDFYYLLGNGLNWQFIKNDIVADVTNSVISYQIQEMAGAAFQVSLIIGNQNNQWIGASPTKTGAAAIAVNKKIIIDQGYVTSKGNEVAPRNIFFIDNITLNTSATDNSAHITGRDVVKKLKTVTTKFAYTFPGVQNYVDLFDGTTLGNWNQLSGTWQENFVAEVFTPNIGNALQATELPTGAEATAIVQNINDDTESSVSFCMVKFPRFDNVDAGYVAVYPLFLDSNNYFRIRFQQNTTTGPFGVAIDAYVDIVIGGVVVHTANHHLITISATPFDREYWGQCVPVYIRKYKYHTYDILIGSPASNYDEAIFDDPGHATHPTIQVFFALDISQYFTATSFLVNGTIGFGVFDFKSVIGGTFIPSVFQYFKYIQFNNSLSLQEAMEHLGGVAGISSFSRRYSFNDTMYSHANYNGSYGVTNRQMTLTPSSIVMNISNVINNGELTFDAVCNTTSGPVFGFSIIFRGNNGLANPSLYYRLHLLNFGGFLIPTLYINNGTFNSPNEYRITPNGLSTLSTPIDITTSHTYRLVMIDQFFYLFIDNRMYFAWHDNNTSLNGLAFSHGFWGVATDALTDLTVGDFRSLTMWNQISNVNINPGDDLDNALNQTMESAYGWTFSDLFGRFIATNLNPADLATFIYQNNLYVLEADSANQDTITEVVVTGSGVLATFSDPVLTAQLGFVRSKSVTDYTITTYQDALVRAQQELINANRFNNQNTPQNPMNVGAEILDAVAIVNTGGNSTNVNGTFRTYNETFANVGSKGQYNIHVETGTL